MRFFRVFLAWLVMAAIPLQGMAAASMLYCGMGAHHGGPAVMEVVQLPASARGGTQLHDHSQHGHGAAVKDKKVADEVKQKLPDASHKCGVCASCCHSLALFEFPQTLVFAPLPQAQLAGPFVLIHARPAVAPDRPPRA